MKLYNIKLTERIDFTGPSMSFQTVSLSWGQVWPSLPKSGFIIYNIWFFPGDIHTETPKI